MGDQKVGGNKMSDHAIWQLDCEPHVSNRMPTSAGGAAPMEGLVASAHIATLFQGARC